VGAEIRVKARLAALKENKFVRFEWLDITDEETRLLLNSGSISKNSAAALPYYNRFRRTRRERKDAVKSLDSQVADLEKGAGI